MTIYLTSSVLYLNYPLKHEAVGPLAVLLFENLQCYIEFIIIFVFISASRKINATYPV